MPDRTLILDHQQVAQKVNRIARQVLENTFNEKEIIVIGVLNRGSILAQRIVHILEGISDLKVELAELRIKDTAKPELSIPAEGLKNKVVLLVDDVLNSGTILMQSARYLVDFDPKQLITVVLVDRKHRLFPIRADFVGLTLATTLQEHIMVEMKNGKDAVYLK